ncbi:hypothetical protein MUO14_08630 [Halobacillus shinanisalinarum]|uniref:Uncharacterized protein n=1 Tax=Halobacillus shinanisalinarum TaxID=2932258 RepID=A0ABY4H3E7_9BACI|nr:hypothetical protein [Halobacillus shinanisalinarum]UOQ94975.1 hypothetical protein MUO14_08630 [Halobacillus shinanisalinarum]
MGRPYHTEANCLCREGLPLQLDRKKSGKGRLRPETHKQSAAVKWFSFTEVNCLCREGLPLVARQEEKRKGAFRPETHKQSAAVKWFSFTEANCLCREGLPLVARQGEKQIFKALHKSRNEFFAKTSFPWGDEEKILYKEWGE